jgi:hypothetical protein
MMTVVVILLVLLPRTLPAQQPRQVNLQAAFDRGDRITVELRNGRRVSGIVGSRLTDGFYILANGPILKGSSSIERYGRCSIRTRGRCSAFRGPS